MTTGVLARAALINSIYKRGVKLTGRARVDLSNSTLINHISTDVRLWPPFSFSIVPDMKRSIGEPD